MFEVHELKDIVKIEPSEFGAEIKDYVSAEIEKVLVCRVIVNTGLGVMLDHLHEVGDEYVVHSSGASFAAVRFSMVVFRPHIGEALIGTVVHVSEDVGVVSMLPSLVPSPSLALLTVS
jgi:DNA-directed RNA polymerase III subunit RPC8